MEIFAEREIVRAGRTYFHFQNFWVLVTIFNTNFSLIPYTFNKKNKTVIVSRVHSPFVSQ